MKNKRKAKILRATVAYLTMASDRHEKRLAIQMAELKDIEAGLNRLVVMATALNTNKEN